MTNLQKIDVRMSEVRQRMNAIAAMSELSEEVRGEEEKLRNEYSDLEVRHRAALIAEPEKPAIETETETREEDHPAGKIELRNYLKAAVGQRKLDGPERELNEELKLEPEDGGVVVPFEALEYRVDVPVSSAPGGTDTQAPILERVFQNSAMMFLGVSMKNIVSGKMAIPVMATGGSASALAPGATKNAEAATYTSKTLSPRRLTSRYLIRREDMALTPDLESSLRRDLGQQIGFALDNMVINGTGSNNQPTGFFASLTPSGTAPASGDDTWEKYITEITDGNVDGLFAYMNSDLSVLVGPKTYSKMSVEVTSNTAVTVEDWARKVGVGLRASAFVPAPASNVQNAILKKGGYMGELSCLAVWSGMELIRDPYTEAAAASVALTALVLYDFVIVRDSAYAELRFRTG